MKHFKGVATIISVRKRNGDIVDFINSSIEHMAAFYVTKDKNGNAF